MDKLDFFRDSQFVGNDPIKQCFLFWCWCPISPTGSPEGYLIIKDRDLEYFRGILTQSLNELLKKGDEAVSFLLESTVEASDPMDKATLEADRNFNLRMRDRENKLIHKIEQKAGSAILSGRPETCYRGSSFPG